MQTINYNGKNIELYDSDEKAERILKKHWVTGVGKGYIEEYQKIEEEALSYLVRNAVIEKHHLELDKIVGLKRNTEHYKEDSGKIKVEMRIEGLPIFRKQP